MHLWKAFGVLLLVPLFLMGQQCGGRYIPMQASLGFCIAYVLVLACFISASRRKRLWVVDSMLIVGTAFLLLPWMQRTIRWIL